MKCSRYLVFAAALCVTLAAMNTLAAQQRQAPRQTQRFRNWDKNGDGELTRDELPERIRQNFDRVDANSDGVITPDEDKAFRDRGRGAVKRPSGRRVRQAVQMPDSIKVVRDIAYAETDNPRQRLDLYRPTKPNSDQPLPVVVWIHGGAWRAGDKASGFGHLRRFVASGDYVGVSVGYRLTDEAAWPAQIHDCKAAIRWIRGNAKKFHLDPSRIGVWGSSAGGHLVAMLGTSGDVKSVEGGLGKYCDQSSRVACVVDYFGPSELLAMGDYPSKMEQNAAESPESKLVGGALQETKEVAKNASPVTFVSKDDPPFLIVHGDKDMTVPHNQSVRLDALLRKVGADVTFITIAGAGHGGFASGELDRRVAQFFAKHLLGKDTQIKGGTIQRGQ